MTEPLQARALRSLVTPEGQLRLSLETIALDPPGPGELLVRVEAAPINPSDLGLMLGPADPASFRAGGTAERPVLVADLPPESLAALRLRIGHPLPVGNEGAGTVIAAGPDGQAMIGRTVALAGGGLYATLRTVPAAAVIPLPEGAVAAQGASMFVNPMTALGFVETMRAQGERALVHTAAASNLGQMLLRICRADGIDLVCVVRGAAQAALLRGQGATHVVDSSAPDFRARLVEAIAATGAMIAFDAVGGGPLASQILDAMEAAAARGMTAYNRYGANRMRQVYVYGTLDPGPTLIERLGYAWKVDGWLLTNFLSAAAPETVARMRRRVADELGTIFASHYGATIGLADALRPEIAAAYEKRGTGAKYLIDPRL